MSADFLFGGVYNLILHFFCNIIGFDKLTETDILTVTHKVGLSRDQLRTLFMELKISDNDVENAQRCADSLDYKIQGNKVLLQWIRMTGKKATRRSIVDALKKCSWTDAAEQLMSKWGE